MFTIEFLSEKLYDINKSNKPVDLQNNMLI